MGSVGFVGGGIGGRKTSAWTALGGRRVFGMGGRRRVRMEVMGMGNVASVAMVANVLTGLVTVGVAVRLREQMRWWSAKGLLRGSLGGLRADGTVVEFGEASEWINCSKLSFREGLSGKVVLLHFWTHGCSNCVHALDVIEKVENVVKDPAFVVVGVHCGKFPAERDSQSVAEAVRRLSVTHPVVNDVELELWKKVGALGWPTLALVGADGVLIDVFSGEPSPESLERAIRSALRFFAPTLDPKLLSTPVQLPDCISDRFSSPLRYPTKIEISSDGSTLFVADSGNHRILEVSNDGKCLRCFGGPQPGLDDGIATAARFRRPHGMFLDEERHQLYVADSGNHAIRVIDLRTAMVETVVGDGEQGFDFEGGSCGSLQRLSSPWDLCLSRRLGRLFVAMAGSHQIWQSDDFPATKRTGFRRFSGNGNERRHDAKSAAEAEWAQPSHLSLSSDEEMLVADAESSSIRAIQLDGSSTRTRTIAGGDRFFEDNLFAFGDRTGRGAAARFSHPLAAVTSPTEPHSAFVADTDNHRIKKLNLHTGDVVNLCGSGQVGHDDTTSLESSTFWEPHSLAISPDGLTLYVADSNNFAIRTIHLPTHQVQTLHIIHQNLPQ